MHLLAAKPGGFVDDEGIVDLGQTPADIVVLAAADGLLNGLATAFDSLPEDYPSVRLANWMQLLKPAAYDLYEDKVLEQTKVVVVSLLGGKHYWPYGFERLQRWCHAAPGRALVVLPGDDAEDPELYQASSIQAELHRHLWHCLRQGGSHNYRQFWLSLADQLLHRSYPWQDAKPLPASVIYQRGEVISLSQWQAQRVEKLPVCLLLFYRSHLQSGNTAMFDELYQVLQQQGLSPLALALSSLKDESALALINELIPRCGVRVILNTTGFASNRVGSPDLASEPTDFQSTFTYPVPVLQLILSGSTEDDWQAQTQGLRSRDIAMQVVLPEMDGRIVTRAVSFKQQSRYHSDCQIDLIQYALHSERAHFVAELAHRYCQLAEKPNAEKRIALILANYPTKDGRIGNGVGLDTPNSTVNILTAMQAAGYPIDSVPENGNVLIETLLGAVTNNPNTLHSRACWQSLSVSEYLHYFQRMPEDCQRAVWQRWGAPEQDVKCRIHDGEARLMLAGIRLGETFVGIQPARGFNLDLAANYHDPDLIPPHSYLAFYFWLRHCYQVEAVVHVGKHGNLEWLPGKGTALSAQCWPDIALGPMPHFYPFIVNDPGEGAQAKRRTQAVIIDHLMPPMTRAETYGELAELETLVDEYYQAMGMDQRREDWLKQAILKQVQDSHLIDELGTPSGDDDALLNDLDTYLCEIKEAQIRHGLHILGALPERNKLADTLVALLRLPRGNTPTTRSLLHNLVLDLGLTQNGQEYDPLQNHPEPWHGERPNVLLQLSQSAWRTTADTRERLETLAQHLVLARVIDGQDDVLFSQHFPATAAQLGHARQRLLRALHQSAEQEIQALIGGLEGRFVPPGPSGAPTRGRLDTLPTGRNFFSVDNRAIPSQAAWELGKQSAEALVLRHLQEHGDYPQQLGLSVWGTATMRTGGDDIAQAFALMGVRPIWAPGSNRVTDFEVLSCMQLGRPRVDVTLRVSGFFRDAFPNVMRLYDAAVQAIAEYDEPGQGNVIQANIKRRQLELRQQGASEVEARRQASYRVFGSKPGAYGAGLQGLIDERCWEQRSDLADAYLNWGGYAYDGSGQDGVKARDSFAYRLAQLDAVVQNQDNREHDLLDSDDYYQFQGGMTNAVTQLSGKAPAIYHSDHSNPAQPKIRTLKEELNRVIRARVLNPKWIEAMREHGYKGAFEMAATVDYLFAYDATTDLIADYQYEAVTEALVFDDENRAFMQQNNPNALEEMAERLLEAVQRGMWQEPGEYQKQLQDLLLDIDEGRESGNS